MDLEKVAIMRLRDGAEISKRYYDKPLMLCYSGGKDSDLILDLAIKSGINFEAQHSHTTALSNKIVLNNDNDDKRQIVEHCQLQGKIIFNPICDWSDSDVWEYINQEHINLNPLYSCGFDRVGCIGCPMTSKKN